MSFFRYPSTPHLNWLGINDVPRDDKLLSRTDARTLLSTEVIVEEKLDGANIGFSLEPDGSLRVQNRGQYLDMPFAGQFRHLTAWLAAHEDSLRSVLSHDLILFGEWCAALHSLDYSALPSWFLLFDVYSLHERRFWSVHRRNLLAHSTGLKTVPEIFKGHTTPDELVKIVLTTPSRYRTHKPLEGIVIRQDSEDWNLARAKLIHPDFVQSIQSHWSRRSIKWNRLNCCT